VADPVGLRTVAPSNHTYRVVGDLKRRTVKEGAPREITVVLGLHDGQVCRHSTYRPLCLPRLRGGNPHRGISKVRADEVRPY